MVTYLNNYHHTIYQTNPTDSYNGVVYITDGTYSGTGSLLQDGKTILTAAHVVDEASNNRVSVYFDTENGHIQIDGTAILHQNYDSHKLNNDVAIIVLDTNAPSEYQRYDLYRDYDEIGEDFTMVGYGMLGNGRRGELDDNLNNLKLKTKNTFDADFYYVDQELDLNWQPIRNSHLSADFDNGTSLSDALGVILDIEDVGLGNLEGMMGSGDSGGPAFIDGKIAGIASYVATLGSFDVDYQLNSSFGELGVWQRVSYFSNWIDTAVRFTYENTPKNLNETQLTITEKDNSIVTNYFYIKIDRNKISGDITLDYTTKDNSAIAGEDYLATSGTVTIYSHEDYALIPVEVLSDDLIEECEYFYLELTNPSKVSFDDNLSKLIAKREIFDFEADLTQSSTQTSFTYETTQYYIEESFDLSMEEANDTILYYVSQDIEFIYNIFLDHGVNNDMLVDILHKSFSALTSEDIEEFFTYHNLESEALGTYYDNGIFLA